MKALRALAGLSGVIAMAAALMLARSHAHAVKPKPWTPIDHSIWQGVVQRFVQDGRVDYQGLKKDGTGLEAYLRTLADLPPDELDSLQAEKGRNPAAKAEWLALWINAYNAWTIKLILDHGIPASIKDIPRRWDLSIVKVAGRVYTLNQVEHHLIRPEGDARIHFAVVCASKGCPPLASFAYTGKDLDRQLTERVKLGLTQPQLLKLDKEKRTLGYSKLFDWFASDFDWAYKGKLFFIMSFVSPEDKDFIEKTFVKAKFLQGGRQYALDYDWTLNGEPAPPAPASAASR